MTRTLWTRTFWADAAERALKTGAQFLVTAIGGSYFDVWQADWLQIGGVTLSGMALSMLTSIASGVAPQGSPGTASLTTSVQAAVR